MPYISPSWTRSEQEKLHGEITFEPYVLEIHLHYFGKANVDCEACRLSHPLSHEAAWASCSVYSGCVAE